MFQVKELIDSKDYAAKMVSKESLAKESRLKKLQGEINIHKNLANENIVKFVHHFHDERFVIMILEYCDSTLKDVLKARKKLTELEVRYYGRMIVRGLIYLKD